MVDFAERKYTPVKATTRMITTTTMRAVLASAKVLFFPILLRIIRYDSALFMRQYLSSDSCCTFLEPRIKESVTPS